MKQSQMFTPTMRDVPADADFFGFPYRITVGKKAAEEIVEVKHRKTSEVVELSVTEVSHFLKRA